MSVFDETWDKPMRIRCEHCQVVYNRKDYNQLEHGLGKCVESVTPKTSTNISSSLNTDMRTLQHDIIAKIKSIPPTVVHEDDEFKILIKSYINPNYIYVQNANREIPCNSVMEALEMIRLLKKKHIDLDD